MQVGSGLGARQPGAAPTVLTIGNFDGVHRGHQALIEEVRAVARTAQADSAVLTFDPHPRCVLDPAHCPLSLTTVTEKEDVLAALGINRMVVLAFTRGVSSWSAEQFCDLLREAFDLRALVVGHDFALGHRRQGDVEFLRAYGARHGFPVVQVDKVGGDGEEVSSSRVRALVAEGDVDTAASLLGRPYFADARVESGAYGGRGLGYPTVDLSIPPQKCLPGPGVYAGWLRAADAWHMAAINVSYRPGFGGDRFTVEAYTLDGSADLEDRDVRTVFVTRLREERTYPSADELVAQIARDIEQVRASLAGRPPSRL